MAADERRGRKRHIGTECDLILALSNYFLPRILEVRGFSMGVNMGVDRVRFPSAVRVGDRLRGGAQRVMVSEIAGGAGLDTIITMTIESGGSVDPACVIKLGRAGCFDGYSTNNYRVPSKGPAPDQGAIPTRIVRRSSSMTKLS